MRAPDRPAGQTRPCPAVSEVLEDRLRLTAPGPWPGGILLSHGLAVRALPVAQVGPFTGSADGVAAARGGELDQAGALLTGGRCAPWRPGQVHRPPSPDPDGMGPPRPLLAAFKSVRDSLSATVPTWTSSMSACYVTVIPRISGEDMSSPAAHSAISGPRIPQARAAPGARRCDRMLNSAIGSPRGVDHDRRPSPASGAAPG